MEHPGHLRWLIIADSAFWWFQPQVSPCSCGCHASPSGSCNHAGTHQIGLAYFFHSAGFFTNCNRECVHANRASAMAADQGIKHCPIQAIESDFIDIEYNQRSIGSTHRDVTIRMNFSEVTDSTKQSVSNTRST